MFGQLRLFRLDFQRIHKTAITTTHPIKLKFTLSLRTRFTISQINKPFKIIIVDKLVISSQKEFRFENLLTWWKISCVTGRVFRASLIKQSSFVHLTYHGKWNFSGFFLVRFCLENYLLSYFTKFLMFASW